jgi:hypothetical protein
VGRFETGEDGAPEEEEELEGEWELDPNDPTHPDHDLSVSAGYANWEPAPEPWLSSQHVVLAITVLIIICLVIIPALYLI